MAKEETFIGGGNRRPVQLAAVKRGCGWTTARRTTFLKVLGETCNVATAARAAGTTKSVYDIRRRDPVFADLWDEALANGYDRLETLLLQRALAGVNAIDVGALAAESDREAEAAAAGDGTVVAPGGHHRPGSGIPRDGLARTDVQLALALLNRRRDGEGRQRRGKPPMTSDEVDALLLAKLDTLARKMRPAR